MTESSPSSSGKHSSGSASHVSLPAGHLFAQRYLIDRGIGQGGMGRVYRAMDRILDVPVALKVIGAGSDIDPEKIARFKREVIVARKVTHPNACRIYDMGESEGILYVSMEYLEGKTLAEILRAQKRLKPEEGIPIIKQVLFALNNAHREGIVHRDIKPENIMVDDRGNAHLMDFGLSISLDSGRMTQTGAIVGTPHYMAPEQFEGKHIDARVDFYAVGVIMFRMFTGKIPFDADSPASVIFAHIKNPPPVPSQINPEITPELETVILRALEKEPSERFQTAREFLQALQPLLPKNAPLTETTAGQEAGKLIAQHYYSKAIKMLRPLVRHFPENIEFQKLLKTASEHRAKRQLRRVRQLLDRNHLLQARLTLAQINPLPDQPAIRNTYKRVHSALSDLCDKSIALSVDEAQKLMDQEQWTLAGAQLESAAALGPADPRIQMLRQILDSNVRNQQSRKTVTELLSELPSLLEIKAYDRAMQRTEEILDENPYLFEAMQWKDTIEKAIKGEEFAQVSEAGRVAFQRNEWNEAARCFRKALEIHPDSNISSMLSETERRLNQESLLRQESPVKKEIQEAPPPIKEEKLPEKPESFVDRRLPYGLQLLQEKKWELAVDYLNKLKIEEPNHPGVIQYLTTAEGAVQRLQEIRAKFDGTHQEMDQHAGGGRWEEALACGNKLLQDDFSDFQLDRELRSMETHLESVKSTRTVQALEDAEALNSSGELNKARWIYQRVLGWESDNPTANSRMREIQKALQKKGPLFTLPAIPRWARWALLGALLLSGAVIGLVQWPPESMVLWRVNRLVKSDQKAQAVQVLKTHLDRGAGSAESRDLYRRLTVDPLAEKIKPILQEARILREARKYEDAFRLYESILQIDPANREAKGEIEYLNRLKSDVERSFQEAQTNYQNKDYDAAWNHVNQVLTLTPDYDPATKLLEEIRKKLVEDRFNRGRDAYRNKQYEQSIALLEEALTLDVSNQRVRTLLEQARAKTKGK